MKNGNGARRLLPLILVLTAQLGCGYALVGRVSNIPPEIHELYVRPFENHTQRQQVDQILTRALSEELVTRKRFSLVNSVAAADAEIRGAVESLTLQPLSFDDDGRATEYQISIIVKVVFQDLAKDEPIWKNDRYIFKQTYPVEISEANYFDRENEAIEEAAEEFAEAMLTDLFEGF